MKSIIILSCVCLFVTLCYAATTTHPSIQKLHLLGKKECTWGPSYWCSNITAAKSCNAVKHCIQTVWEHQTLPADNDSVCDICLKMVKEARDQLESNQTQEEIKEVFEGSCKFIPIKMISEECCNLADQFIPELIETLASQMNPNVVCSVAGLCNSLKIDKLLEIASKNESASTASKEISINVKKDECEGCRSVVATIQLNFQKMSRDQVLHGFLNVCGRMSSFSDACTNIVLTYFNEIYTHLQENLNPDEVCLLAGVCSAQFHTHNVNVEITPLSDNGKVNIAVNDLPCDLCEQLVRHLRDLLIANTTELEFQRVLEGICSQMKSFSEECTNIVDEYYPQIYKFMVTELNPNTVCNFIGICPNFGEQDEGPMWALVPPETAVKAIKIINNGNNKFIGNVEKNSYKPKSSTVKIIQNGKNVDVSNPELVQLPIERMLPSSLTLTGNTELCVFCEYFLHFVQEEMTSPKTKEKIKQLVDKACEKLPKSVNEQCVQFVDMYGDAFIALLATEIDPSQVCPLLSLCPAANVQEVEILMHSKSSGNSNCPLCLFAVTELENMVKNKKTEDEIRTALNKLCSHLPKNLVDECEDFVHTYTDELIEMLIADLTPQEICVYLKLCPDNSTKIQNNESQKINGDWTLTNEIPDNTIGGQNMDNYGTPLCSFCKVILTEMEHLININMSVDEIKSEIYKACHTLPGNLNTDCTQFIDKHGDIIAKLIKELVSPSEICSYMFLCTNNALNVKEEVLDCAICEATIEALEKLLNNPKVDHNMEHVLKKACLALPHRHLEKCKTMIDTYGDSFFHLISKISNPREVCQKVGLCGDFYSRTIRATAVGGNSCTWGPSFWCENINNANKCNATKHCEENKLGYAQK